MASESTYGTMSSLIGNIYDIALDVIREMNVIAPLVTVWNDVNDSRPRVWSQYSGGAFAALDENTDGTAQAFHGSAVGTATPAVTFQQIFLTDRRIRTDPMGAQAAAGRYLGQLAAENVDSTLSGYFDDLTSGTVGTAGGTLTFANILYAAALVRAQKVSGPLACVVGPAHWYYISAASSGVPTLMQSERIMNSVLGQWYQGSFAGIDIFTDANIASGTAKYGAVFSPQAIYLDIRNPFKIEPQRDASRGGGGYELNAQMEYASGVFRPTFGCALYGKNS